MSEKEFEKYRQHRLTVICTMCLKCAYCQKNRFTSSVSRTSFQGREEGIFKWCFVIVLWREEFVCTCSYIFTYMLVYVLYVSFHVCACVCKYECISMVCDSNHTTLLKGTIFAFYITQLRCETWCAWCYVWSSKDFFLRS